MLKTFEIVVSPEIASNTQKLEKFIKDKHSTQTLEMHEFRVIRKSIDARGKDIKFNLKVEAAFGESLPIKNYLITDYKYVKNSPEVHIIGAGPAGLFAALRLLELGRKPIIFERGSDISQRKRQIAQICRNQEINTESNYCFGEGGAGTFSDGKLYTRSKKRGNNQNILFQLVQHGASEEILIEAHPHIGTNKLPGIIENIRSTILQHGGEIHFNTKVTDFFLHDGKITGIQISGNLRIDCQNVILATGHSARDIYEILAEKKIALEPKSFAMGVRIEHPQELIDQIQYHQKGSRNEYLPAAAYNWVEQVNGRAVFSFCMCPGGFIVPASTGKNEIVVNGMSPSSRNSPFANSGLVVEIRPEDFKNSAKNPLLAGLRYQQNLENLASINGKPNLIAPAQRISDFVSGKFSQTLPQCSYLPEINSSMLSKWLPKEIGERIKEAIIQVDKKMKGYLTSEGVIVGVESRTSTPVKIPRNNETLQHIHVEGLYPCGEGAGYAGGIVSAAIDGVRCAEKCAGL